VTPFVTLFLKLTHCHTMRFVTLFRGFERNCDCHKFVTSQSHYPFVTPVYSLEYGVSQMSRVKGGY